MEGCVVVQAISRRCVATEDRVKSRISSCGLYGEQSGIGECFYPSSSVFSLS